MSQYIAINGLVYGIPVDAWNVTHYRKNRDYETDTTVFTKPRPLPNHFSIADTDEECRRLATKHLHDLADIYRKGGWSVTLTDSYMEAWKNGYMNRYQIQKILHIDCIHIQR